jgi:N-acetylmuramoyl-L-alanine amidase
LIVIDPGHGGQDIGASGPHGVQEKVLTLAISKSLAAALREMVAAEVLLTRTSDRYVTLDERNAIGNRAKADLFISIHANAAESPAPHGIETYYLNTASDKAAQRLADRENRAFGKEISTLQKILTTLQQNALTDESRELAVAVQGGMIRDLHRTIPDIQDKHVKTALFYVLVGSKTPSILVETGFVTNPAEEKRLNSSAYQRQLARAIASGVKQFLEAGMAAQKNL